MISENFCQQPESQSGLLHMGGANLSRERTERLTCRLQHTLIGVPGLNGIWFPKPKKDSDVLELIELYIRKSGFSSLEQAITRLDLPKKRLMAVPVNEIQKSAAIKPKELLRNAIILGRTSGMTYDPDIPPVFTQRRLDRQLDFFTISTNSFYELD